MRNQKKSTYFSPKNAAIAIGVSESSLKRWCDRGLLRFSKTAGGHRRLQKSEILRFSIETKHPIVQPEALGLPPKMETPFASQQELINRVAQILLSADEQGMRQIILNQFLNGRPPQWIFDQVILPAFDAVGDELDCNKVEDLQEKKGCEISLNVAEELKSLISDPPSIAPIAIGGSLTGDIYGLPTVGFEVALRAAGWQATSLGPNLPVESVINAVLQMKPRIAWISISHIVNREKMIADVNLLNQSIPPSTSLVLGGSAITPELKSHLSCTAFCGDLQSLINFVRPMNRASFNTPPPT